MIKVSFFIYNLKQENYFFTYNIRERGSNNLQEYCLSPICEIEKHDKIPSPHTHIQISERDR
jgi:hypothetical protein